MLLYRNPRWLREVVASRARGRQSLGAWTSDYDAFISLFNIRAISFESTDATEVPKSEVVVDVIKKEYINTTEQDSEDSVEIKDQKPLSGSASRKYHLTVGTQQHGVDLQVDASFFNLAGPSFNLNSNIDTDSTTPMSIGKDYYVTDTVKIPAKTKLEVTLATYSVNYRIPGVHVVISAPVSSSVKVILVRKCPWQNQILSITAEDYLKVLCGPDSVQVVGDEVMATQVTQLTYLGQKTKVSKVATKVA